MYSLIARFILIYTIMELKDKVAVITGSTGALGSELTLALARAGCHCVCHYHDNKQKADQLVTGIKALGRDAVAIKADLTKEPQIDALFESAGSLIPPRILVNSASVFPRTPLCDITSDQARSVLGLNLIACILTAKAFAKAVKQASNDTDAPLAKIINISDTAAIKPWKNYSLYCASKAGLTGATKSLAKELAPEILVNALAPGIATWPDDTPAEDKKRQLSFIPANRFAKMEEITAALIFLSQNDYMTGQTLAVDGGRSI